MSEVMVITSEKAGRQNHYHRKHRNRSGTVRLQRLC